MLHNHVGLIRSTLHKGHISAFHVHRSELLGNPVQRPRTPVICRVLPDPVPLTHSPESKILSTTRKAWEFPDGSPDLGLYPFCFL